MVVFLTITGLICATPHGIGLYGAQDDHIRFSHSAHSALACEQCHTSVKDAHRSHDVQDPGHAQCESCHQETHSKSQQDCQYCHQELPARAIQERPYRGLEFSHRLHQRSGITCDACHTPDRHGAQSLPSMSLCQDCHQETQAMNECRHCHQTLPSGRLKTQFDHYTLKPSVVTFPEIAHSKNFEHGRSARMTPQLCQTCHQDDECLDCHLTTRQLAIHPPEYLRHHAVDAIQDSARCTQCHAPEKFCTQCHDSAGISQRPGQRQFGRQGSIRRFHPPGFVGQNGGVWSADHHGHAARRSLNSCVSCHQETDCMNCHSMQTPLGLRASPHPPQFRCGRAPDVAATGCLKCHSSAFELKRLCDRKGR